MLDLNALKTDIISADHLTVEAGQCVMLRGPSGSGKSYFFRVLADLVPWHGSMTLDQKSSGDFTGPQWRQQVMLVPAESHWWLPRIADHFRSPHSLQLNKVGLDRSVLDRDPQYLSSGEKQRLSLLRALDRKPRVLLLDEPSANLDPDRTDQVENLLTQWCREQNGYLIMTSHDPAQRKRLADKHWQIQDGQVTEAGEQSP